MRAVVTGAGPGSIGEATADALAARGVDVIVTTRTRPSDRHEWRPLDLADRGSVEAFVDWFTSQHDDLDLLVNSAGVHLDLGSRWREPVLVDGHEIHWRVNYLGTVHLTQRLLPALLQATERTGEARVVHLTSRLHARGDTDALLGRPHAYDSWTAYGTSKLGLVHHAAELAEVYGGRGLRAYAVHPGAVSTGIADRGLETRPGLRRLRAAARPIERVVLKSPAGAAAAILVPALDPGARSGYYRMARPTEPAPGARDLTARAELMRQTAEWLDGR